MPDDLSPSAGQEGFMEMMSRYPESASLAGSQYRRTTMNFNVRLLSKEHSFTEM
ncbi:hypothetical protein [Endozoicomonas sp. 8E]|uniref:hypothetical protein n=1 Tax=Endozoicomonas sp. 8E TaxID=3035692 RepID=UPI0029393234|nr:hypothetical protein [Endozoicomonas sp. 8E]WOG26223.1 hypothetical protein P6910_16855 [Endozoicomonas sp. 8E]